MVLDCVTSLQHGADLLWIETMSSMEEIEAAIEGCRSVSDLPNRYLAYSWGFLLTL